MTDTDPRVASLRAYAHQEFAHAPDGRKAASPPGASWRTAITVGAILGGLNFAPLAAWEALSWRDQTILKTRGVDMPAILAGKQVFHGKGGPSYQLAYSFRPTGARGPATLGHAYTTRARFDAAQPGLSVPVTYDPRSPRRNALDFDGQAHTRQPGRDVAGVMALVFCVDVVIGVVVAISIRRSGLRPRRR